MYRYYLAIDIGASSGRHILAHIEDDRICTEEIYRFDNGNAESDGHRIWDVDRLFDEIINGMRKCRESGKIPHSMGIDTWGVDYVLLDKEGMRIGPAYAYRDKRTDGMDEEVYRLISAEELYGRTGIQKAVFNTIFQLMAAKRSEPENLDKAEYLLMIPDYFNYLLTGVKKQEYTNATTTGLVSPVTKTWDYELIDRLGFPRHLFGSLSLPGERLGGLTEDIIREIGYDCEVILPGTHDTASAVVSVPDVSDNTMSETGESPVCGSTIYISSGTWSLIGCELNEAICTPAACRANFTNEGGYGYRFRFLKNIMGLWMIQSVRAEIDDGSEDLSYDNLCRRAEYENIESTVDADDDRFLAPVSMTEEIRAACRESGQQVPQAPWEYARVIYRSLAGCYAEAVKEIEDITGKRFATINIVGGGSNAEYLNRLTEEACDKKVIAGPAEATAIGNIGVQMIADGLYSDIIELREAIKNS